MARIVSVGSALQDIYLIDHDDLRPTAIGDTAIFGNILVGSKVEIDRLSFEVGGGAINSAITFARNNHEAIVFSNIARDSAGQAILKTLNREGIDNSFIKFLDHKTTGTSIILLDSKSGERTILSCRGASNKFDNLEIDDLDFVSPDWLYITTLRGDYETLEKLFEKAKKLGSKIMFNPGKGELENSKRLLKLLKNVDILLVNKSEAAEIVPGVLLEELLYHLRDYTETIIITDGSMGGIAGNSKETYRFGIYEDIKMRDATGAGDAFGSGFLASLAAGKSFKDSLIFASANSTSVVQQIGASRGIINHNNDLHLMPIQKI